MDYTNTISKSLCTLLAVLLFSTMVNADSQSPTRKAIEQTAAKKDNFSAANDYSSWAGLFAVDGTFANVMLPEPVVGRDAIVELSNRGRTDKPLKFPCESVIRHHSLSEQHRMPAR